MTPGRWRGAVGALTGLVLVAAVTAGTPVANAATTPAHSSAWRSYPTAVGAFNAVSCASSRFCVAVGWSTGTDYFVTYNGRSWSPARLAEQFEGEMESVSCPVVGWCAAITDLAAVTVFQRGQWSKLTTVDPNPGPPYPGMVAAISCSSPRFCVAVDGQGNAETFDGTGWSRPRLVDPDYPLNDVSCASPGDCAAVDGYGQVAALTGDRWSAARPVDITAFTGISCARADFCVAVDLLGRAVVGHGGQWSVPVAVDQVAASPLSVSCPAEGRCVAVDSQGSETTLSTGRWAPLQAIDIGGDLVDISCSPGRQLFCAAVDGSGGVLTSTAPGPAHPPAAEG